MFYFFPNHCDAETHEIENARKTINKTKNEKKNPRKFCCRKRRLTGGCDFEQPCQYTRNRSEVILLARRYWPHRIYHRGNSLTYIRFRCTLGNETLFINVYDRVSIYICIVYLYIRLLERL